MSKKQIKKIVIMGAGCGVLLIAGIIYSLLFNDGRWVKEMDMSNYIFSAKDIPMLVIGAIIGMYTIYLVVIGVKTAFSRKDAAVNYTRKVSPLFGLLGIFGCFGFVGFWTYSKMGVIFPFIFFGLFGLFGLFFEGKLSHTFEDELFLENKRRAELKAYKTGFILLFLVIWLMGMGMFSHNIEWCAIFMLISTSLIYAFILFLSNYLLYRYEKEE